MKFLLAMALEALHAMAMAKARVTSKIMKFTHKTHRVGQLLLDGIERKRNSMAITHMPIAMKCNQIERRHKHKHKHKHKRNAVAHAKQRRCPSMLLRSAPTLNFRQAWIDKMPYNPYNSCVILIKANRIYYA